MSDCIFCKIIAKEISTDLLYEDDYIIAFKDIRPKADVHILVVTKEHIKSLKELQPEHNELIMHTISKLKTIANNNKLEDFRLITNAGSGAGQEIDHLHFHILGGGNKLPGF